MEDILQDFESNPTEKDDEKFNRLWAITMVVLITSLVIVIVYGVAIGKITLSFK